MTPASRNLSALTLASSLAGRLLGRHADSASLLRSLPAATGIGRVATRWHVALDTKQPSYSHRLGFASMAQPQQEHSSLPVEQRQLQDQQQPQQQQLQAVQPQQPSAPAGPPPLRPFTGFKKTFYKRKLPSPPAIEFSSPEGRQLFQEALLEGSMVGFFKLMEQFNTQDEPAFCGLASLAMVLNALSIDPRRTWKGSWRWFHEAMLDCCRPLELVKKEGITLYQASCLARCNGARVEMRPHGSTSLERFRAEVEAVCRSGEEHIVVSYSRKAFLQTGDGHFSPIGGYHRGRDLALVLDVARFKYPPHWVPLPMLYSAMSYTDPETGRPRGYMRLSSNPLLDSVLLSLDIRSEGWRPADAFVRAGAAELVRELAAQGGLSGEDVVRQVVDAMPLASLDAFLVVRSGAPLVMAGREAAATAAAVVLDVVPEGPPCATPDAMAAAVRQASEVGTAAAAAAAAAGNAAAAAGDIDSTSTSVATSAATAKDADVDHSLDPFLRSPYGTSSHHRTVSYSKKAPCPGSGGASKGCGGGCGSSAGGCGSSTTTATATATATVTNGPQSTPNATTTAGSGACCSSSNPSSSSKPSTTTTSSSSSSITTSSSSSSSNHNSNVMAAAAAVFTARDRCVPLGQRQQLLDELRGMPLYHLVSAHLAARREQEQAGTAAAAAAAASGGACAGGTGLTCTTATEGVEAAAPGAAATQPQQRQQAPQYQAEKVVMALLMQSPDAWPPPEAWADGAAAEAQWQALVGCGGFSVVEAEAAYLREQLAHIDEVLQSGDIHGTCGEHSSRLDCAAHGH